MYRYVNIVCTCGFCQVLFKVFHIADEEILLAAEVFAHLAVLIEYVNCDVLFLVVFQWFDWSDIIRIILGIIMEGTERDLSAV